MVFNKYAKVYDLINSDKNYQAEAAEVMEMLSRHTAVKKLLVIGCGTGKHDRAFSEAGYDVRGIDLSAEMIDIAKMYNHELGIKYEVADIRTYETQSKYKAVVSLFHVMSYMVKTNDLLAAFQSVAALMESGGIFIFDAWHGPGVINDKPAIRVKRVKSDSMQILRIAEPTTDIKTNTVEVHYEIQVFNEEDASRENFEETHFMRYLFIPEVEYLLEEAGFKLIECLDCKTLGQPKDDTWTVYFVAKKI